MPSTVVEQVMISFLVSMTSWPSGKGVRSEIDFRRFPGFESRGGRFFIRPYTYETLLTDSFLRAYTMYCGLIAKLSFWGTGVPCHPATWRELLKYALASH